MSIFVQHKLVELGPGFSRSLLDLSLHSYARYNKIKLLFIFSTLILFTSLCWSDERLPEKICKNFAWAKLDSLQGKLFFDPQSNGVWQQAQLNDFICEGSRLRVGPYSRASLSLNNGVVLRLDQNTILSLNGLSHNKPILLDMLKGLIHFLSRTPTRLEITSPIINAGPEGTEFTMKVDEASAALWVNEGVVKFYNKNGRLRLSPGQGAQALIGQAPLSQINIKPEDAVNWALYYPSILPFSDMESEKDKGIQSAINNFRHGHVDDALFKLDNLSLKKHSVYFYKVRAAIRLIAGQVALASQDIETLKVQTPGDTEALALQSIMMLTLNHKEEAYILANKAVASDRYSASAYSALSYAEQARFNLDNALEAADQAVKNAVDDALVWARKAELELSKGLILSSEQSAQHALQLDNSLERTHTVMGFTYLLQMDTEAALKAFEKAISFDSTAPLARLGLGLAKIRKGNLKEGRQDLEVAAILDPNNSLIRSYLGKAYYEEKRNLHANDQFSLAKKYDQNDPTPYFYDAILKQTTNRPIEALYDMQKAISLNDNRGVYRSNLMLDKDKASRQVGLGRIYNSLGFDDVANRLAINSLTIDSNNYSAHRLLSDSYVNESRFERSRASELLQSQLLQPLNFNPIQPRLAYNNLLIIKGVGPTELSFNEYNRLFDGNGLRFTTSGIYGSFNTIGNESALSGIYDKFSFSLGQFHYQTDGFRENNGVNHNLYNAFAQYELSSKLNLQAEYRHRETENGDLELKGDRQDFNATYLSKPKQDTYRFGLKYSPAHHSDILVSFIHSYLDGNFKFDLGNITYNSKNYDVETQYLFNSNLVNTIAGGGMYSSENSDYLNVVDTTGPLNNITDQFKSSQYFGYLYSNIHFINSLKLTAGISLDHYSSDRDVDEIKLNELNPKFGLLWQVNNYLNFRAAAFKTVTSALVNNQILQPTQIAGFNQFFDDFYGTVAWQLSVGLDANWHKNVFVGVEAYSRDLKIHFGPDTLKPREELYRLYLNWTPHTNWAVNSEFRFESYRGDKSFSFFPEIVETAYVPTEIRFFNPNGFFAALKGNYVNQKVQQSTDQTGNFNSDFYLVDAAVGYRFPKQYGLISFEVKNIFDTNFQYRDRQYQINVQRSPDFLPERLLFARLTVNF